MQDGVEFLVGALLVQLDENTPAMRMDDPGGYFFANTSLVRTPCHLLSIYCTDHDSALKREYGGVSSHAEHSEAVSGCMISW